jgi:hypothetical protein
MADRTIRRDQAVDDAQIQYSKGLPKMMNGSLPLAQEPYHSIEMSIVGRP